MGADDVVGAALLEGALVGKMETVGKTDAEGALVLDEELDFGALGVLDEADEVPLPSPLGPACPGESDSPFNPRIRCR